MLDAEFKYYLDHQDEIVKSHNGKVVVIKGNKVVDAFENYQQAHVESVKKYKLGTFLLQLCTPGDEAYTIKFNRPNVTFA
jgi:penicillin-binding protein-related factor A (putative recombinase)